MMRGSFLGRAAAMGGYELSVIGEDDVWFWLVGRGQTVSEGREDTLAAAMDAAEEARDHLAWRAALDHASRGGRPVDGDANLAEDAPGATRQGRPRLIDPERELGDRLD